MATSGEEETRTMKSYLEHCELFEHLLGTWTGNCSICWLWPLRTEFEQTNGAYRLFSEKNQIGKCTILPDNEYGNGPLATQIFVDLCCKWTLTKNRIARSVSHVAHTMLARFGMVCARGRCEKRGKWVKWILVVDVCSCIFWAVLWEKQRVHNVR